MQKHETPDSIRLGILLIKEQTTTNKQKEEVITMENELVLRPTYWASVSGGKEYA